jgi:hypothetical protein
MVEGLRGIGLDCKMLEIEVSNQVLLLLFS